jgi:hypothetical protein
VVCIGRQVFAPGTNELSARKNHDEDNGSLLHPSAHIPPPAPDGRGPALGVNGDVYAAASLRKWMTIHLCKLNLCFEALVGLGLWDTGARVRCFPKAAGTI